MNGNPHKNQEIFLSAQIIISALEQLRENRYSFAKHIHKSIEIYLIRTGCCSMDIGSRKVLCTAGDFILIPPNTVHSFYLETDHICTFGHIHFDPDPFSRWYLDHAEPYPLDLITALIFSCSSHFKLPADGKIAFLTDEIIKETANGDSSSLTLANLHLAELMLYLIRLRQADSPVLTGPGNRTPDYIRYVSYAISYIHANYTEKILIHDIANRLNISIRYLSKVFFQHMNLTILNYINIYRVNQAIELMLDTDLTLTHIAVLIGLKDSQHFSKLFRSIIGLSPSRYRKLLLKEMKAEAGER